MLKKIIFFTVIMTSIFFYRIEQCEAITFVDSCNTTSTSPEAEYRNFSSSNAVGELFGVEKGISGSCLYIEDSSVKGSAFYKFENAQEVKVSCICFNSMSVFTNGNREFALGKPDSHFKYFSPSAFLSESGCPFFEGRALNFESGYYFNIPSDGKKVSYLGANVYSVDQNGEKTFVPRALETMRTTRRFYGDEIYLEEYIFKLPPNSKGVGICLSGSTKVYYQGKLIPYIQKIPYAIRKVEISGENMRKIASHPKEELVENSEKMESTNKKSSKKSSNNFVVVVESETYNDTTENTTIYDNDTIVQNIYGSAHSQKQNPTIPEQEVPVAVVLGENKISLPEGFVKEESGQKNTGWQLAGFAYIGVSAVMLITALLVKKNKK